MKHLYSANINNVCKICSRGAADHSDNAQCEACVNIGPCELLNGMLLCESCLAHDLELAKQPEPISEKDARVHALTIRSREKVPTDRRQYFVGRMMAIVDIEKELLDIYGEDKQTAYQKTAQIAEANHLLLKERIAGKHAEIRELQGEAVADQTYLNQIVPQLRAEEREKFKAYDITYQPTIPVKAVTTSKPRQSASDRAMESLAKTMGVTLEQAKLLMNNAMKTVTGAVCSCKETPGVCAVHVK